MHLVDGRAGDVQEADEHGLPLGPGGGEEEPPAQGLLLRRPLPHRVLPEQARGRRRPGRWPRQQQHPAADAQLQPPEEQLLRPHRADE